MLTGRVSCLSIRCVESRDVSNIWLIILSSVYSFGVLRSVESSGVECKGIRNEQRCVLLDVLKLLEGPPGVVLTSYVAYSITYI